MGAFYIVPCDNPDVKYHANLEPITDEIIRVSNAPFMEHGFMMYSNYNYLLGDYSKFTTNFETPNLPYGTYDYSSNGSKWSDYHKEPIEPEPSEEDRIQTVIDRNMKEKWLPRIKELEDIVYAMYMMLVGMDVDENDTHNMDAINNDYNSNSKSK